MKNLFLKFILTGIVASFAALTGFSQTSVSSFQKTSIKTADVFDRMEDSVRKQFEAKKLSWPPQNMFIRSFKYDRQMEVWVKSDNKSPYKLFKTYKVCMQSGTIGPKRMKSDNKSDRI